MRDNDSPANPIVARHESTKDDAVRIYIYLNELLNVPGRETAELTEDQARELRDALIVLLDRGNSHVVSVSFRLRGQRTIQTT